MDNKSAQTHNIRSILRMNEFLKRLFCGYLSIYEILANVRDDIIKLQNDLNFSNPGEQIIEQYNKIIIYLFDQINATLSQTISTKECSEILVIKPVNSDKGQFSHKLEVSYFVPPDMVCITKPIGESNNISITKVNSYISLSRNLQTYTFTLIDNSSVITLNYFRDHLDKYMIMVKTLISLLFNDIEFTKISFRSLLGIISDVMRSSSCEKEKRKWFELLDKVKENIDCVFNTIMELK